MRAQFLPPSLGVGCSGGGGAGLPGEGTLELAHEGWAGLLPPDSLRPCSSLFLDTTPAPCALMGAFTQKSLLSAPPPTLQHLPAPPPSFLFFLHGSYYYPTFFIFFFFVYYPFQPPLPTLAQTPEYRVLLFCSLLYP